jgi:tRNA-2-methylthio-N6-dimethylallyladenosine synthase
VQSGSNRILKRMIRRYTREEYLFRADRLRTARPGLTLSTDLIVGFPGETEEDFAATLSLVREAGFTTAFTYKYSVRPHTPARKLIDDVSEEVKAERLQRLIDLIEAQGTAYLGSLVGTTTQVLVEGRSKRGARGETPAGDIYHGRSERNEVVHVEFPTGAAPIGDLVEVAITRAHKHSLVGELAAAPRARYLQAPALVASRAPDAHRHLPVVS